MTTKENTVRAVVHKTILDGTHGPYAVATCKSLGSVTFSLDSDVWPEHELPTPGIYVHLSNLQKKRAGWRANEARFLRPSDEENKTEQ